MGNILVINKIADDREKAKQISKMVQKRRSNGDNRTFAEILQDEIDKSRGDANGKY